MGRDFSETRSSLDPSCLSAFLLLPTGLDTWEARILWMGENIEFATLSSWPRAQRV